MITITLRGLQEAQRHNLKMIQSLQPDGYLDDVVRDGTIQAHRYAVTITHVWHVLGGGLRASHRMRRLSFARYEIYIDPYAINPRGQRVIDYAFQEHQRGGTHAFYQRVEEERGREIGEAMGRRLASWWG